MSVTRRGDRWVVRWRDQGRRLHKTFDRKRDADLYDTEIRRARRLGTLALLDAGTSTLDSYVESTWTPIHAATVAEKTLKRYAGQYDNHVSPALGQLPLRDITAEVIGRWQADLLRTGVPVQEVRKTAGLLGSILQRATESGRIASNPARLVRKPPAAPRPEVRPLAPSSVEAIRSALLDGAGRDHRSTRRDVLELRDRDAVMVSILAYAGLRPQEMRALRWGHVLDRTLVVHAPKTRRHRAQPRSVRLLAPLAADLREWRIRSGRPDLDRLVIPALDGGEISESAFQDWRDGPWKAALESAGIAYQRPYDLRHSFASLLLHEGRSVIYVARQLGHGADLTLKTYGHVIDELEDQPQISAEEAIRDARAETGGRKMDATAE